MSAQEPGASSGLHRRKLKPWFGFVSQYELDGSRTKIAHAIEDHDVGHLGSKRRARRCMDLALYPSRVRSNEVLGIRGLAVGGDNLAIDRLLCVRRFDKAERYFVP